MKALEFSDLIAAKMDVNTATQTTTFTTGTTSCNEWTSVWVEPSTTYYFHTPTHWWYYPCKCHCGEDKTQRALSIVKFLMDKKFVKITSIKSFVGLLDEITRQL